MKMMEKRTRQAMSPYRGRGLVGVDEPAAPGAKAVWVVPADEDFVAISGAKRFPWAVVVWCSEALPVKFPPGLPGVGSVVCAQDREVRVFSTL